MASEWLEAERTERVDQLVMFLTNKELRASTHGDMGDGADVVMTDQQKAQLEALREIQRREQQRAQAEWEATKAAEAAAAQASAAKAAPAAPTAGA